MVLVYTIDGTCHNVKIDELFNFTSGQKLHRENGPAIISDSFEEYWVNGRRHREDGPALIHNDRFLHVWFFEGQAHRLDGPAVIHSGQYEYYIHGCELSFKDWLKVREWM